jgi:hypothetical protein
MRQGHARCGVLTACTLTGVVVAPFLLAPWAHDSELGSYRARQQLWERFVVSSTIGGAFTGLAVGLFIDVVANGRLRIPPSRFSRKTFVLVAAAFAVLAFGLWSLWDIAQLPAPNF